MYLSGSEIRTATNGRWLGSMPDAVHGIVTDTRNFDRGDVFLALRGPNYDGHRYGADVVDKAAALIGDHDGLALWSDLEIDQLEVDDTLQALGDIAHAWRQQLSDTTVIAISGSYGKTSLRSILELAFTKLGKTVAATQANLNNLIGVPQTLLAVPASADIALIECGISEKGEMGRLAEIVQPDIAILTGITTAHSEGLGGIEGVVREKAALFKGVSEGGWCAAGAGVAKQLSYYGESCTDKVLQVGQACCVADVNWQLNGKTLLLQRGHEFAQIKLQLAAPHWASNMALAAAVMLRYYEQFGGLSLEDVAAAMAQWQPPAGRMQMLSGSHGMTVLDDSYNANPVSMQAAIDTLREIEGNRIAVLGDMAELGSESERGHASLNIADLDRVYLVGPQMQALAAKHSTARWFFSTAHAVEALSREHFGEHDYVLVKASRSMKLESVVTLLCDGEVKHAV